MLHRAREILGVKENELEEFECDEPIHGHHFKGIICRKADDRYGALILFQVNGESCEQVIFGTPKLHYPFDKAGTYCWPSIDELCIYDKVDGTNVLAFHYSYQQKDYVTCKTRLSPVLRDGKFGSFLTLWKEYTAKNKWIEEVIRANPDYHLSFELTGSRNPITVVYDYPLRVDLLFGVSQKDQVIVPPFLLKTNPDVLTPQEFPAGSEGDLTLAYNQMREQMSRQNKGKEKFVVEGMVFYGLCAGEKSWQMFKCKPEEIEKIHWANAAIQKNALWTTAINVFENGDQPTLPDLIKLLEEEYTESQIKISETRIKKTFDEVYTHVKFVKEVNEVWKLANEKGFDVTQDKGATMRFIAQSFSKNQMRKVGSIILKQAGLI